MQATATLEPGMVLIGTLDGHCYWGTPEMARAELVRQGWRETAAAELVEIALEQPQPGSAA